MKFEISHDTLAKQIFEKSSAEAKNRRKVKALVERGLERFHDRKILLTQDDLDEIKFFQTAINFSDDEESLIRKSRKAISRRKRRNFIITTGVILTLLALLGMSILSTCQVGAAKLEIQHELEKAQADKFALEAQAKLNEGYYSNALDLAVLSNSYKSWRFDYEVPNSNKKILSDAFYEFVGKKKPVLVKENYDRGGFLQSELSLSDTLIVTESSSNSINIFNLKRTGMKKGFRFKEPSKQLQFLKEDKILRLGSDGEASILSNEKIILNSNEAQIDSLYYNSEYSKIVGASSGSIFIWNIQGQLLDTIETVSHRIFSATNSVLYTTDSSLCKIDLSDGSLSKTILATTSPYLNFSDAYTSIDGSILFIHAGNFGLLWNTSTGDTLSIPHEIPATRKGKQFYLETVFSPRGDLFFTLTNTNPRSQSNNYEITLRDNSGHPLESFKLCNYSIIWSDGKYIEDISFSPDGSQLACLCGNDASSSVDQNQIHTIAIKQLDPPYSINEIDINDLVDFENVHLEFFRPF